MEEDIKILEELFGEVELTIGGCVDRLDKKERQALENLIKGYRELEKHISFYEKNGSYKKRIIELKEENEELKEQVEYLKHEVVLHGSTVEKLVREKMNSIPKSKIKEKIEKHIKIRDMYKWNAQGYSFNRENEIIKEYQELMEDK